MRRLIVASLIALCVSAPIATHAQPVGPPALDTSSTSSSRLLRLLAQHDQHDPFEVFAEQRPAYVMSFSIGDPNARKAGFPAFLCYFSPAL